MKIKNFHLKLNENLAELIGAFIGDGFIGRYGGSYHVEFSGNKELDKKYYEFLSSVIKHNFNVKPRTKVREGALRLIITYKELHEFFIKLGFKDGIKNNTVFIPNELYKSKLVNRVMRGIFDTDGYIFVDKRAVYKKPYIRIGFSTKSKRLYNQVKSLFLKKNYKIYTRIDKRYNIYNLEIYGNDQASRWLKEFGFSNLDKKNYASLAQLVER